jgi:hypothetical protein
VGKPKAPAPPDYVGAAHAQGQENENSAIATNFLNQVNQSGPYGNLSYTYDKSHGYTLPDGTVIPSVTATTTLSPEQQHLLDQQTGISTQLNDLASQGIGNVSNQVSHPIDTSTLPALTGNLNPNNQSSVDLRNQITDAMMARLQPSIDRDRAALDTKLANQGITNGSSAYNNDQGVFQQGVNDQRIAALLAGDQEQQNDFNRGLASAQFGNSARNQAMQEAEFLRSEPLNMLNALRTGNQVNLPTFGNVAGGAGIAAAPIYQATNDQYAAAMQNYQQQVANQNALLGGIAGLGSAAITKFSDRRLKHSIKELFTRLDGLKVYLFKYLWNDDWEIGVMADEVALRRPEALGPIIAGYATVDYGKL